ncbi:hypothetical protein LINPERHAP2_LOCUS7854 [Linum perenne]
MYNKCIGNQNRKIQCGSSSPTAMTVHQPSSPFINFSCPLCFPPFIDKQATMAIEAEKLTWKIDNFSTLNTLVLCSDTFLSGDYKWRIVLFPKRQVTVLEFVDADIMPEGWIVSANVTSSLYRESGRTRTYLDGTSSTCEFKNGNTTSWPLVYSYHWTKPIGKKQKIRKLVNRCSDTVVIEARLSNITTSVPTAAAAANESKLTAAARNLNAEISSLTIGQKLSTTTSGSLQQQERGKLAAFLEKSVEAISEANAFDEIEGIILKIAEQETDPVKKEALLNNMLGRVAEFKQSTPEFMTTIQTSTTAEASINELEGRLLTKQEKISVLESNVSRLGDEEANLESEIQVLVARKEKLAEEKKSTEAELEEMNQEASMELEEMKKQMRAKEKLAHFNATWKLFNEYL